MDKKKLIINVLIYSVFTPFFIFVLWLLQSGLIERTITEAAFYAVQWLEPIMSRGRFF